MAVTIMETQLHDGIAQLAGIHFHRGCRHLNWQPVLECPEQLDDGNFGMDVMTAVQMIETVITVPYLYRNCHDWTHG